MQLLIFALLSFLFKFVYTARMLAIIPTPLFSHQVAFRNIIKDLSKKHDVVLITAMPMDDLTLSNVTEIDVSEFGGAVRQLIIENEAMWKHQTHGLNKEFMEPVVEAGYKIIFEHPQVQQLLNDPSEKFDLVFCDITYEILSMFAVHFNCPLIGLSSFTPSRKWLSQMGNPIMPSVLAHQEVGKFVNLRFLDKVISILYFSEIWSSPEETYFPSLHYMTAKYFGFEHFDLFKKIDLLFVYTNPVLKLHLPSVPTVVEVGGGTHINPVQELDKDVKDFVDSSNGTIYVSLGTTIALFPIYKVISEALLEIFEELPSFNFLWRVEGGAENLRLPRNVKVFDWGPQQDILRHSKITAFIMQGGQQSLEEALYSHVPVLLIPFVGDQFINADIVKHFDIGKVLYLQEFSKHSCKAALLDVINKPEYKTKMKHLSELSADQPMSGLEKAIWWTEYVLRHKGAKHLRNNIADMSAFEYYLFDVLIILLIFLTTFILAIYKALKMLCTKKLKKE